MGPQSELRAIKPVASFTLIDSQFEEHAAKERVFLASSWGKKEAAWIEGWRRHTAGQILALNGSDGGAEARLRAREGSERSEAELAIRLAVAAPFSAGQVSLTKKTLHLDDAAVSDHFEPSIDGYLDDGHRCSMLVVPLFEDPSLDLTPGSAD